MKKSFVEADSTVLKDFVIMSALFVMASIPWQAFVLVVLQTLIYSKLEPVFKALVEE